MTKRKGTEKPGKPRPDFPLYSHPGGQWAKKIGGQHRFFGLWDNPDGAEQAYLDYLARQRLGLQEPEPGDITVDEMVDKYLDARQKHVDRRAAGHTKNILAPRTFREIKRNVLWLADAEVYGMRIGQRVVSSLRAADFTELYNQIPSHLGVDSVRHRIHYINGAFNFARKNEWIKAVPNYGTDWAAPSDTEIEAERTSKPEKLWTRAQIKKLLAEANPTMKAFIHLGVNAAMGNSDLARLKLDEYDGQFLRVPRGKNGRPRKCWLWPETREAIDKAIKSRPEPREGYEDLLFLTRTGGAWTDDHTCYDGVGDEFRELKETCGFTGAKFQGIHFYALRHVFADVASNTGGTNADDVATKHVLGHLEKAVIRKYRTQLSDTRIKKVCQRVQKWLFGKEAKS
ncbi:hypothetical protein U8335_02350 [Roseiconus lacunae]|uniref:tyrosine-type recombinase/integrase n=1 Tax=Roseiconus lacunae TaxID=2605694 RepID=UPI003090FD86|nr:hypothetical protein U8335_02350 [Stieleria sp. HD01]